MQIGRRKFTARQLGNLVVLFVLAFVVSWYLRDAWRASGEVLNLILVLPVSMVVLALCGVEFVRELLRGGPKEEKGEREPIATVVPIISLFVGYVLTLGWIGFDVGTVVFVAASLWIHGERRLRWALGYAISFGVIVCLLFSTMLPYPMPMLIFPTGG